MSLRSVALMSLPCLLSAADFSASKWVRVAPAGEEKIHAMAAHGKHLFAGSDSGVFRSPDRGKSWKRVDGAAGYAFAAVGDRLFTGSLYHVYRTADGGDNWTDASDQSCGANMICFTTQVKSLAVAGRYLFAGVQGIGVFRSQDFGESWTELKNGVKNPGVLSMASQDPFIYAGTPWGVFVSEDQGKTWTDSAGGPSYTLALAVHGGQIFTGTLRAGVWRSADHGKTWNEANAELDEPYVPVLLSAGKSLYAGTAGGVYRHAEKEDGWKPQGKGISDRPIFAMAALGNTLFAGSDSGFVYCLGPDCPRR